MYFKIIHTISYDGHVKPVTELSELSVLSAVVGVEISRQKSERHAATAVKFRHQKDRKKIVVWVENTTV